ncbi:MAG: type II secretion system protein [Rubrivivax sp.]|nr:MAG: type II secretion system protein [Rubrivivax sp.]
MNRIKHPKAQTGFTMVELIVVIVILGILSAVALPKFANLQGDARVAKLNAARGSVAAAAAMTHGAALARHNVNPQPACPATGTVANINAAGNGTLCTENPALIAITNLYPSASAAGIIAAAGIVTTEGYTVVAGNPITVRVTGAPTPASCQFTYAAAVALNTAPVLTNSVVSGC